MRSRADAIILETQYRPLFIPVLVPGNIYMAKVAIDSEPTHAQLSY